MEKLKNKIIIICLIFICIPIIAMADEEVIMPEYTEEYKKWLEIPEEERQNYIEPQTFKLGESDSTQTLSDSEIEIENQLDTNELGATETSYIRDYYGSVKNQGSTQSCWAFSAATAFDANYYVINSTKKTFSNLHMEYKTSRNYNSNGFNRQVDSSGNMQIALAYATNGMGIALEQDMPTSNITESAIQAIKSVAKVSDYVKLTTKTEVKNYIRNYGVVSAITYMSSNYFSSTNRNYNYDLAYCCTDTTTTTDGSIIPAISANHAVTLVGWDDEYTNDSFPGKQGAYIALNSYGAQFGKNGLYYIFYDDIYVQQTMLGVTKTEDIDYDYLYQYDEYGCTAEGGYRITSYGANVFKRSNTEYSDLLTEISAYFPSSGKVTIYVNANGSDVAVANATYTLNTIIGQAGYHTIKLSEPIELKASEFVVGIKYPTGAMGVEIAGSSGWTSTATSNGESYMSYDGVNYKTTEEVFTAYQYSNICIKAFTKQGNKIAPEKYSVNISKNIGNAGTVKGSGTFNSGTKVTVKQTTNSGYRFVGWYNGDKCMSTSSSYTFALSENITLTAKYEYVADIANYTFDYQYYADHNADLVKAFGYDQNALKNHWNAYGKKEGRKASPVFDAKYYLSNNSDLKKAFGNDYLAAYNHFISYGYAEYRKSSAEYDGSYYKKNNSDLKNMTSAELIRHYTTYGKKEARRANVNYDVVSYLFDADVYAACNADLRKAFGNNEEALRKHWYTYGIKEGRTASLVFNAKYYLSNNSDLKKAFGSNYTAAYNHFVEYGFAEGRQASVVFSTKYYINNNSDVKKKYSSNYIGALNHFLTTGKNSTRLTSSKFNVTTYRLKNADLRKAFNENYSEYYVHYLVYGQKEKRVCI